MTVGNTGEAIDVGFIQLGNISGTKIDVTVTIDGTQTYIVPVDANSVVTVPSLRSTDRVQLSAAGVNVKYLVAFRLLS